MCGIAGIIKTDGILVQPEHLAVLRQSLRHRGPDGEKTWVSENGSCGLVHLRLAILDIGERSDQPMMSMDGSATIVFNGEIYNFLEVRAELEQKGVHFRTESDTEVLLEAWRVWGPGMLERLNGMFALVLHDNRSGRVFMARDRFGVKPLLYAQGPGFFAFASEMRALTALPFVPKDIDRDVAARLLFDPFSVEASERTLHSAIQRLPAGHYAVLEDGVLTMNRWWRTVDHLPDPPRTLDEAAATFRELFLDSVRLRMRSDVKIGTCLSGGFDSTAVVSSMAHMANAAGTDHRRESEDWRHAFIASFPSLPHDETPEARLAAAHAGATPQILDLSGDDGPADVDAVMKALDDVYISLPTAIWKLYRFVNASGVRVTLDGHGADEMIGAYKGAGFSVGYLIRQWLGIGGAGRSDRSFAFSDAVKLMALRITGDVFLRGRTVAPPRLSIAAMDDQLPAHWGRLNRRLYGMFHASILPTLMRNFDRLSMAHGVEVRMPFMDWRLVTFAMSLPDDMKSGGGLTKLIAREAMRGIMPETIRASPRKIGFNSQMPDWLNGSLGEWAANLVARPGHPAFDAVVDRQALLRRLQRLNAGKGWNWTTTGRLWPYINLKWYLDRLCPSPPPASGEDVGVSR